MLVRAALFLVALVVGNATLQTTHHRRSGDEAGGGEEGDDDSRHHQYQQKNIGFGNGRHGVVCEEEKREKKGWVVFCLNTIYFY